ncbi:MAG: hypothetical protein V1926_06490 [Candidatus Peregrinibacteria bacterium]
MHIKTFLSFGIAVSVSGLLWGLSPVVHAEESASYRLYQEAPNYAVRAPAASPSYLLNENGVTWIALPVASFHYQIVTAPPASASSASSASSSSLSTEVPGSTGGHRGHGTVVAELIAQKQKAERAIADRALPRAPEHAAPGPAVPKSGVPSSPRTAPAVKHPTASPPPSITHRIIRAFGTNVWSWGAPADAPSPRRENLRWLILILLAIIVVETALFMRRSFFSRRKTRPRTRSRRHPRSLR